jgi:cytosine/uracil/thiamine/allantoin permease
MKTNPTENNILNERIVNSDLYNKDLAPLSKAQQNWSMWDLAALWVGVAVCIPTYVLASDIIKSGLNWLEALIIIILGNIIITIPMVLNGKAGVKYGLPFPVIGRAAFGINGVHFASVLRALVACGWFGIQTWIGGLSIYVIGCKLFNVQIQDSLCFGQFIGFAIFWLINMFFIWRGTESIKWLEEWSAPILIFVGLLLIGWGWYGAGSFGLVLKQSEQLSAKTAYIKQSANNLILYLNPIKNEQGNFRADSFRLAMPIANNQQDTSIFLYINSTISPVINLQETFPNINQFELIKQKKNIFIQFKKKENSEKNIVSSFIAAPITEESELKNSGRWWLYLKFLTIMVGFWATMSISISDISRYTNSQKKQILGQFIGLPTTMALYSFVGIFVTCAAIVNFTDILASEDAPWNPVGLLARFDTIWVVVLAQLTMLIATLSTNIAANVIAPAYAFANLSPQKLSFKSGGLIAGLIGIICCPWVLLGSIANILLFVSGLLGPILGVLISDYFVVKKQNLDINALYDRYGIYSGVNKTAFIAVIVGVGVILLGYFIPSLAILYQLSWFVGFAVAFLLYSFLAKR